jgi:hypothetical protein
MVDSLGSDRERTAGSAPGLWRVQPGLLAEHGDHYVDRDGRLTPLRLEDIGRPVPENLIVLRVERRRHVR